MAPRKEASNLRGDPVSPGNRIVKECAKKTPSKREPSPLPVPGVERKVAKFDPESNRKVGSSTAAEELHVVDKSDGSKWTIRDKTVIDLLKRYNSAPDQKTKDEIVKQLQSYVASLGNSKISQESKQSSNKCSRYEPPMPMTADLSKIAKKVQKLKLDEIPQAFMSSTKTQASRSDKQIQDSRKGGGEKGDLDGNCMNVDKNSSHQPSMQDSVRLSQDDKDLMNKSFDNLKTLCEDMTQTLHPSFQLFSS